MGKGGHSEGAGVRGFKPKGRSEDFSVIQHTAKQCRKTNYKDETRKQKKQRITMRTADQNEKNMMEFNELDSF